MSLEQTLPFDLDLHLETMPAAPSNEIDDDVDPLSEDCDCDSCTSGGTEGSLVSSSDDDDEYEDEGLNAKAPGDRKHKEVWSDYVQWGVGPNGSYRPNTLTVDTLPSATYKFEMDNQGNIIIVTMDIVTDELTSLPDSSNEAVINGIRDFWDSKARYKKHGILHKRGVLLHGPPGSGKTVTISLLSGELIRQGGIVVFAEHPGVAIRGLSSIRKIEKERPIICILEDIDEIISRYGEHDILSLLDGENQIDNIVMIATTNYPDKLPARIANRPSRFDEMVEVGMPTEAARRAYLKAVAKDEVFDVDRWVADTKNFSIAHIRELFTAVICLGKSYDVTMKRIKTMMKALTSKSGFKDGHSGFAVPSPATAVIDAPHGNFSGTLNDSQKR